MPYDRAVLKQADGDVGILNRVFRGVVHGGTAGGQGLCLGAGAVPGMYTVASFEQAVCNGQAHHPGAKDGDAKRCSGGHGAMWW